jgi:hypothetical protein
VFPDFDAGLQFSDLRNATHMIMMPMSEQDSPNAGILVSQDLTKSVGPYRFAFTGVDKNSFGTRSDEISVCALQCELAGIATSDAYNGWAEARDRGKIGQGGCHAGRFAMSEERVRL